MITQTQLQDTLEALEARERNNQALCYQRTMKHFVKIEDIQERQRKAIKHARWCLSQGWPEMARQALDGI